MSKFLKILCLLAMVACNRNKTEKKIPNPGQSTLPQIYMLTDSAYDSTWKIPRPESLAASLDAHAEETKLTHPPQGEEALRVLNAKPVDLLILAPGLAQDLWFKTKLPRESRRQIIVFDAPLTQKNLWLQEMSKDDRIILVDSDQESVKRLLTKLCMQKKWSFGQGCHFSVSDAFRNKFLNKWGIEENKKSPLVVAIDSLESTDVKPVVHVKLNWAELLGHILREKESPRRQQSIKLNFQTAFLSLEQGSTQNSDWDKEIDAGLKEWTLAELRNP